MSESETNVKNPIEASIAQTISDSIKPSVDIDLSTPTTKTTPIVEATRPEISTGDTLDFINDSARKRSRIEGSTIGDSLNTAAREVIPFAREIQDKRPLFPSFAFEDKKIDYSDPEVKQAINDIGIENNEEALTMGSKEELFNMRDQIKAADADIKYMGENHGVAGSMGLYLAASLLDPTSYLGYTMASKMYNVAKVADKISKMGKAGKAASYAAAPMAIEGSSEAYIQATGARHYESVGATMLFAGVLGGGGSLFMDTLKTQRSARTKKAFDDLTKGGVTLKSNPEQAKSNLDAIFKEDSLAPYRQKILNKIPSIFKRYKNSPTFIAYEQGGALAALAARFDTLAGNLAPETAVFGKNDEMIYKPELNNGRTAMDVKYEMMEHFVQLEYARLTEYKKHYDSAISRGEEPLSKDAFAVKTYNEISRLQQAYRTRKLHHIDEINKDDKTVEGLAAAVDRELEDDMKYKDMEEEEKISFRDSKIEAEVNNLAAKRMMDEPEYKNTASTEHVAMVDALNKYYEDMRVSMEKAGIPFARTMDSRFYQPIMYKKDAISNNKAAAREAFETAIRESSDYIHMLQKAKNDLEIAKSQANVDIKDRDKLEIKIQTLEGKLDDIGAEKIRLMVIMDDPSIPAINKAIELNGYIRMSGTIIDDTLDRAFKVGKDIYTKRYFYEEERHKYFKNGKTISESSYSEKLYEGNAKPLSHEEFENIKGYDTKSMISGKSEEEVRELMQKILDSDENVAEILNASGTRIEDFVGSGYGTREPHGPYSGPNKELGGRIDNSQTAVHEVLHNLSLEMRQNNKAREDIIGIQNEIRDRYDEIEKELQKEGLDLKSDSGIVTQDGVSLTIEERLNYMTDIKEDELFSVGLSNPMIANALNNIMSRQKIKGKRVSLFAKMMNAIKNYLGVDKINKGSILDNMQNVLKQNAVVRKATKTENKLHSEYRTATEDVRKKTEINKQARENKEYKEAQIESLEEEALLHGSLDELKAKEGYKELVKERTVLRGKYTKAKKALDKSIEESNLAAKRIVDFKNSQIEKLEAKFQKTKDRLESESKKLKMQQNNKISEARKELKRVTKLPAQQAKGTVDKISKTGRESSLAELGFGNPSVLKSRSLNIDAGHKAMSPYIRNNEADVNNVYQYSVSGKAAVMNATGFDNVTDYRRFLEDNGMTKKEDLQVAEDLFELTLGTRQIADDPNSVAQDAVKLIKSANYITMGGQFAQYGVSEIGAAVYSANFKYLSELLPALKTTMKMYMGKQVSQAEMDMVRMAEAGEIWSHNSSAKYGDYNEVSSGFIENKAVKIADKMSRFMFRFSGLEGISTLTKIALPRAYIERIINQAGDGLSHYDLIRWGIQPEDMLRIKDAPVIRNEKGTIIDFNFKDWDKDLADKFQLSASRMSRDAIMRPDAIRMPAWLNDGNSIYRLFGQFQSFAFMANERLFQRGLTEEKSMALIGSVISASLLGLMAVAAEQVALKMGIIDEDEMKYDATTEKGLLNIGKHVAFRNSFVGTPQMMAEAFIDANTYNGGERTIGKAGGPTVGRLYNMGKAAKEFGWEGKTGTRSQAHVLKSAMPFNNMLGVDYLNKGLFNDWYNESKMRDFNQNEGFKGLKN